MGIYASWYHRYSSTPEAISNVEKITNTRYITFSNYFLVLQLELTTYFLRCTYTYVQKQNTFPCKGLFVIGAIYKTKLRSIHSVGCEMANMQLLQPPPSLYHDRPTSFQLFRLRPHQTPTAKQNTKPIKQNFFTAVRFRYSSIGQSIVSNCTRQSTVDRSNRRSNTGD